MVMAQAVMGLINATLGLLPSSNKSGHLIKPSYTTAEAGNPFVEGWYADPDTEIYDNQYWVFPTVSDVYERQTYLDAFSSPDLISWTKHSHILSVADVKWANRALWAPAPISRHGKYYLYFGANDIQEDEDKNGFIGGIGVAVADKPEGPYVDAIGKPLIGHYHHGAQPIDQAVFIDDVDDQAYIYYGGHGRANVAKLNNDMVSIGTFDDGTQFKEITPQNYVEGSLMKKRNGIYYFMWSEGGWGGPDYSVSYAMSSSPLGPFKRKAKILQQDDAVAKSSGHHGVINVPGTDIWYIVYHRRPLSETARDHRVLAYDRMYFNEDGTIAPVRMLVKDNFADGKMIAWKTYGGDWSAANKRLEVSSPDGGLALLDTNFGDLVFDATVTLTGKKTPSNSAAGLFFRVTPYESSPAKLKGYFVGVSPAGLVLRLLGTSTSAMLIEAAAPVSVNQDHRLRVKAVGSEIQVFFDDLETPKFKFVGATHMTGTTGVMAEAEAAFGDISVAYP